MAKIIDVLAVNVWHEANVIAGVVEVRFLVLEDRTVCLSYDSQEGVREELHFSKQQWLDLTTRLLGMVGDT